MKPYRPFFIFLALLVTASLACAGGASTPATPTPFPTLPPVPTNPPPVAPTLQPVPTNPPPVAPTDQSALPTDDTLITYTDQNNLWAFNLPGNWKHEYTDLGKNLYSDTTAYVDKFTSPDGSAYIDSIVMFADKGVKVNNTISQSVALDLLNTYYSKTGTNNGDIRIKSDQIMKDGSERFQWISKSGFYSGVSYFEVRGDDKRTWLMWTLVWDDDAPQDILDIINNAIDSYYVP